jgi:hypothetical protein
VYHYGNASAVGDVLSGMQFGIFTVGDVTTDPTTGTTPSEAERIRATVTIAKKAEEVELDIFATGEHHNPPFVPSSPKDWPGDGPRPVRLRHARLQVNRDGLGS